MNAFIESAYSRETSTEIMEAILRVAGGDLAHAESIWEDGPDGDELSRIIQIVTKDGLYDASDFVWGESGCDWARQS